MPRPADKIPEHVDFVEEELLEAPAEDRPATLENVARAKAELLDALRESRRDRAVREIDSYRQLVGEAEAGEMKDAEREAASRSKGEDPALKGKSKPAK